jgi:hypothetical protein
MRDVLQPETVLVGTAILLSGPVFAGYFRRRKIPVRVLARAAEKRPAKDQQRQARWGFYAVFFCAALAAQALFGLRACGQEPKPVREYPAPSAGAARVNIALSLFSHTPQQEFARRMLLLEEAPGNASVILGSPRLEPAPEGRFSMATPGVAINSANYLWDGALWGRLECLRQPRIRGSLFGSRIQRCSLG